MSEIEKMYENAGIRRGRMSDDDCAEYCLDYECKNCRYSSYPPFTAEKQIELIKWLANKFSFFAIEYNSQEWSSSNGIISGYHKNSLEESIANYINNLWQDLTSEEKQQVKGILE